MLTCSSSSVIELKLLTRNRSQERFTFRFQYTSDAASFDDAEMLFHRPLDDGESIRITSRKVDTV